jgi:hypothetical protein
MTMLTEKKFEQLSSCVCCMMKEDREGHCSFCLDLHAYYSTEKTMPKLPTLPDDLGSREAAEVFEAVLMLEPYTTLCIYSYQNDRSRANLSVDVIILLS